MGCLTIGILFVVVCPIMWMVGLFVWGLVGSIIILSLLYFIGKKATKYEPLTPFETRSIEDIAGRITFEVSGMTDGLNAFRPEVRTIILKTIEEWKNS